MASTIKGFLGFSEPEEGPLSNFHTYMPDMIDLMTQGIQRGKQRVKAAAQVLAEGLSDGVNDQDQPDPQPTDWRFPTPQQPKGGFGGFISKAKDALFGFVGGMNTMAKAGVVSTGTAQQMSSTTNNSKNVVQNVNINNQFNGDRAGQQKSATAMEKASEDATSEMARALRVGR